MSRCREIYIYTQLTHIHTLICLLMNQIIIVTSNDKIMKINAKIMGNFTRLELSKPLKFSKTRFIHFFTNGY